jgi:PAS domain-containing protein
MTDLRVQIAAREKAEARLSERATGLEVRIRRLVNANLMGVFTWTVGGKIVEVNETFLSIVGRGREDVASGSLRWTELTPAEWQARDELAMSDLMATGTAQPYRKENRIGRERHHENFRRQGTGGESRMDRERWRWITNQSRCSNGKAVEWRMWIRTILRWTKKL